MLRRIPSHNPLPYIVAAILALTVCKGLLVCGHSALAARINSQATHVLRMRIFSRLLNLSQAQLEATGTARLINLLATDTWHTSDALSLFIGLVINACSILVFTTLLIALSWKLTLLVGLGVAVVTLALQAVTSRARNWGREALHANTTLSEHMLDALDGLREVQIFGLRKHRASLFEDLSGRVRSIYFRLDLLNRLVSPISEILCVALLLGFLLIGVAGLGSIPSMIVFLLVLYRMQPQIRQMDSGRLSLAALASPVEAVVNFLATPVSQPLYAPFKSARNAVHGSIGRTIDFDRVSFSYDMERERAVEDISFQVPFGKTTAIVGPSGSGKTTLVSLLCRFYEPQQGRILLEGRPLSGVDPDDWRSQIAWVSQDAHIFSASAKENIRYGNLNATEEEIVCAAQAAGADIFIRQLPDGYSTKIGNGGAQLSSGQTQRIALARAFLRKPSLLILDEATNALDSISEECIRAPVRRMQGECTALVISHRLSAVYGADHVVVLSEGRISEQGTPRELALGHGLFSRFLELQHVE